MITKQDMEDVLEQMQEIVQEINDTLKRMLDPVNQLKEFALNPFCYDNEEYFNMQI